MKIIKVIVNQNPNKWLWFNGAPNRYVTLLMNQSFKYAKSFGGMLLIDCEDCLLVFTDGVQLSYLTNVDDLKHQLLLEFVDHSFFVVSVRMHGLLIIL